MVGYFCKLCYRKEIRGVGIESFNEYRGISNPVSRVMREPWYVAVIGETVSAKNVNNFSPSKRY